MKTIIALCTVVLILVAGAAAVGAACPTPTPTDVPPPTPTDEGRSTVLVTPVPNTPTSVPTIQPSPTPVIVLEETPLWVTPTDTAKDCEDSTAVPTPHTRLRDATTVSIVLLPETGGDQSWALWGAAGASCCLGLVLAYLFAWSLCVVSKRSQERMERMDHGTDNR